MLLYESCGQLILNSPRHNDSVAGYHHESLPTNPPSSRRIPQYLEQECPKHDGAHAVLIRRPAFFFPAPGRSIIGFWLSTSSTSARRTSATDQAWATQPRGVWGASASKISETWPRQASLRCCSIPVKSLRAL